MVNSKLIAPLAGQAVNDEGMAKALPLSAVRLRERMEEMGETQEGLAAAVGATQGAISQILTGATRNSRFMPKIAYKLAVNLDWLNGSTDQKIDMFDPDGRNLSEDDLAAIRAGQSDKALVKPEQLGGAKAPPIERLDDDTVEIEEFDLSYGMGSSYLHEEHRSSRKRKFSLGWVRHFSDSPISKLMFARGIGDSMMPAIHNNDLLLIDTDQQTPRMWDQYWAVQMGGMGMIKRLRPTKDGLGMQLVSENKELPIETAYDGEMQIVGRVVAIIKKV